MNLLRAHTLLLWAGGVWVALLAALALKPVQRSLIYLHQVRLPLDADFQHPEAYGFAPGKVLPFNLTTSDGAVLGAWQVLPDDVYASYVSAKGVPLEGPLPQSVFDDALVSASHPTCLYWHGNAASRAASNRVRVGRHMASHGTNFVIVDYRGFADSSKVPPPSEAGLLVDARRAWDFLTLEKGVPARQIGIMGQSLGTGVSSGLAGQLALEGISPRALILIAPFSSIPHLLETYKLGSLIPVLAPFRSIPGAVETFLKLLHTRFDTKSIIQTVRAPILILHAINDKTIPSSHSTTLFSHLLEPLLPPQYFSTPSSIITALNSNDPSIRSRVLLETAERERVRIALVKEQQMGGWGVVRRFGREGYGEGKWGEVTFAEAMRGGHNEIGAGEASMALIKEIMRAGGE